MLRKVVLAVSAAMLCIPVLAAAEPKGEAAANRAAVWFADAAAGASLKESAEASASLTRTGGRVGGVAESAEEATAVAVSESYLKQGKGTGKQLASWLSDGKQVYVYGEGLTVPSVADKLGIRELAAAGEEAAEKAGSKKGSLEGEQVQLVGVQEEEQGRYHLTSMKLDATKDGKGVSAPLSLVQQAVLETEQLRAAERAPIEGMQCRDCEPYPDPEEDPIPAPSAVTVLTGSDATTKYIFDGSSYVAIASITSSWSLTRNLLYDQGANYDLFYVRDNIQIDLHNGATAVNASTYHQLPYYAKDDLAGWGPSNSSVVTVDGAWRRYPVKLPWDTSWTSSNLGDLSFYSEYRANEAAYWNMNAFSSKVTFSPGTAWLSYYTYAIIDLLHTVNVQYNGSTYSMTLNRTVTYDY